MSEKLLTEDSTAALEYMAEVSPPFDECTVEEARAAFKTLVRGATKEHEPVGSVEDRVVSAGGSVAVGVRIYRPEAVGTGSLPLVLMMHGGGWAFGDLETYDASARSLCNAARAVVVAVDYRRTPEHPFPAALDDTYAVLVWAVSNCEQLGADRNRLFVVGDSAGGNLAAAVCLLSRERQGPAIAGQILIYPALDARCDSPSVSEYGQGHFLTSTKLKWYWDMYLPDEVMRSSFLACPSRAGILTGLPSALVLTAEADPLRDEGEMYALALRDAGVPTEYKCYPGVIHPFALMPKFFPEAHEVTVDCATFIQGADSAEVDERTSQ